MYVHVMLYKPNSPSSLLLCVHKCMCKPPGTGQTRFTHLSCVYTPSTERSSRHCWHIPFISPPFIADEAAQLLMTFVFKGAYRWRPNIIWAESSSSSGLLPRTCSQPPWFLLRMWKMWPNVSIGEARRWHVPVTGWRSEVPGYAEESQTVRAVLGKQWSNGERARDWKKKGLSMRKKRGEARWGKKALVSFLQNKDLWNAAIPNCLLVFASNGDSSSSNRILLNPYHISRTLPSFLTSSLPQFALKQYLVYGPRTTAA